VFFARPIASPHADFVRHAWGLSSVCGLNVNVSKRRNKRSPRKPQRTQSTVVPAKGRGFWTAPTTCIFLAISLALVGLAAWAAHSTWSSNDLGPPPAPQIGSDVHRMQLVSEIDSTLAESRAVLLGQRPEGDPTCITRDLQDHRVVLQGSPTGGIGLRIVAFYSESPENPMALYEWCQMKLRPFLRGQRDANASALVRAERLATVTRELADSIRGGAMPSVGGVSVLPAWPAECLRRLEAAVAAGDSLSSRIWADELAAAAFALADLHRWLNVLLDSHLVSLDFQARCRTAFEWAERVAQEPRKDQESCLPAAGQMVALCVNYLEAERQAEGLFGPPATWAATVVSQELSNTPAARWMPPEVRPTFLAVRDCLSTAARAVWDRAAAAPFERSYLANMLFRAASAGVLEQMALVLQRFEQSHRAVTIAELMDVLFYRAGLHSSGFPWSDRYDPRILNAAGAVAGTRDVTILRAHGLVNGILKGWENYVGGIPTLADCLDAGKLDCVRGTDLVGALYRGAGQGEFFVIRLNCGVVGHSVGAVPLGQANERRLLIVDCLDSQMPSQTWPRAFFHGLTWPVGYPGEKGKLFSAELYARGLDGCLFAEGYVVRGEHAGHWVRAALPYLPGGEKAASAKIFEGPYPE